MTSTPKLLPHDVKEALIEVCGRSFWYKQPLFDVFARAGVPEELYVQYEDEAKFKIARKTLGDLERKGAEGLSIQRRLITELCKFRRLPDSDVPDKDAALDALGRLKACVEEHDLGTEKEQNSAARRALDAVRTIQREQYRSRQLAILHKKFVDMTVSSAAQRRGYDLEDLLKELFAVYEIQYRKSYRTNAEQIDGFFHFHGFDYLVETRWRSEQFTQNDLLVFKGKVDQKIQSTRGMVVSVNGFHKDIVRRIRDAGSANIILVDGQDLALVLEDQVRLTDALHRKIDKAAQEGVVYFRLADLFADIPHAYENT